ncbi:MAG: hypothetical protein L0170_05435 [Acidobacteria bacterium]|nr:hypothetical protein [Acidobacteriota bacterium]
MKTIVRIEQLDGSLRPYVRDFEQVVDAYGPFNHDGTTDFIEELDRRIMANPAPFFALPEW